MARLEDAGLLEQPHISAGRVPTAKGYRMYVRNYLEPSRHEISVRRRFETLKEQYFKRKDQERVYEAVSLLAHMIPDVAFAKVPHKAQVYYVGLSNALKQPEFQGDPRLVSGVAEVLEEHLSSILERIEVDADIRYYIGDEHLLPQIPSCSLIVTEYALRPAGRIGAGRADGEKGVIGILGPMRMDYAYNTVALELAADLLRSH